MKYIQLLAPAKNYEQGCAAIDHGADAVYVGPAHGGARQQAGNSVEDIKKLCDYAHRFGAHVHATLNTIVYDEEMEATVRLARQLVDAGVDAFLVQDMGLLERLKEWVPAHVALHASTQCDTRTAEKAAWLRQQGFDRVVLARELSLKEIADIHKALPDLELEAFVHGALCVSYSGICYASQYCFGRSANRGACAQFCRLAFDLKDSDGRTIEHNRHLLSLKDMNQLGHLEQLIEAGACSFKIEGRLKDINYVKNVVAAYSQRLDEIIAAHPTEYRRSSLGHVRYKFTPDLKKTFNRGYTDYFAEGRHPDIFSPDTPKALGEYVGHVKELRRDSFNVAGTATFANGDGLCFLHRSDDGSLQLEGFRVNRAVGNRLYPFKMPRGLRPGMALYRNQDQAFEKELGGESAVRTIPVTLVFAPADDGFSLSMTVQEGLTATATVAFAHDEAKKPQHDNIVRQLTKLGGTAYQADDVEITGGADGYFIPSSLLADLRRQAVTALDEAVMEWGRRKESLSGQAGSVCPTVFSPAAANASQYARFPYLYNISNAVAVRFYEEQGLDNIRPAMETAPKSTGDALLMQCRHCIRYSLGYCVRRGGKQPTWHEPLFLELPDHRRFRLEFDCKDCQMNVHVCQ